jgi:hypothetical protein
MLLQAAGGAGSGGKATTETARRILETLDNIAKVG